MLLSMDHECTPDCPICIPEPEEDLLKFAEERKIVPQSTPIAMWFLYIACAFLAIAAVEGPFRGGRAIVGRDHQSHVASGGQASIGLAERLDDIENLLKDVRLLLGESANAMAAKEAGTTAKDDPNPGPIPSRDNLQSPRAASSSEKKPDALAAWHQFGYVSVIQLVTASLILTWLAVRGYIFETDPDNFGRESGSEVGTRTESVDSGSEVVCAVMPETNTAAGNNSGWDTDDADYSGDQSSLGTDFEFFGGVSGCWTDCDYSGGDSGGWTDADNSGSDFSLGADREETDSDDSGQVSARDLLTDISWKSDWEETDSDYSGQVSARGLPGSLTNCREVNKALTEGIRDFGSEEGTSNFDEETVTTVQEPVISKFHIVLPKIESSSSQESMTSSSTETAGFPHEVEVNFTISGQRLPSSTLGGLSERKVSVFVWKGSIESLHSEDDEIVQKEEVDYASRRDKESRAATMVQARYRGHLVRMSRPLVQLREIAGIEEKLTKMKELAKNGSFVDYLRGKGASGKSAAEEETMKLLLHLDNIQASHPFVRQTRKSVTREIVFLQKRLDALLS